MDGHASVLPDVETLRKELRPQGILVLGSQKVLPGMSMEPKGEEVHIAYIRAKGQLRVNHVIYNAEGVEELRRLGLITSGALKRDSELRTALQTLRNALRHALEALEDVISKGQV